MYERTRVSENSLFFLQAGNNRLHLLTQPSLIRYGHDNDSYVFNSRKQMDTKNIDAW